MVNIEEDYENVTLKMLIALKFVTCYCPNAEYLVKADDDTFINIAALDREISKTQNTIIAEQKIFRHGSAMTKEDRKKVYAYIGRENKERVFSFRCQVKKK